MTNTKFDAYTAVNLQCDFDYVCRGTCNEREARSSLRKRQGGCRECSRFFM